MSVILLLRSRQVRIKSLLSDMGELSLHGMGTSQIVPKCEAAAVPASPINRFQAHLSTGLYP